MHVQDYIYLRSKILNRIPVVEQGHSAFKICYGAGSRDVYFIK